MLPAQFGQAPNSFRLQRRGIAGDRRFVGAANLRHAAIEGGDQLLELFRHMTAVRRHQLVSAGGGPLTPVAAPPPLRPPPSPLAITPSLFGPAAPGGPPPASWAARG